MKKILLASVGLVAMGVASASAADMQRRAEMPTKAAYITPAYNWSGAYIGLSGGYGWGTSDFGAPLNSGSFNTQGGLVGGTLGYNYQIGQTVLGLEGDVSWSGISGSGTCGGVSCSTRNNWLSTARGRVGLAVDRFMPYITGGAAFGDIKTSVAGFPDATTTKTGWTAGGGVEAALSGPWTAKLEYLYVDLGRGGANLAGADASFKSNIVRAGINYRF